MTLFFQIIGTVLVATGLLRLILEILEICFDESIFLSNFSSKIAKIFAIFVGSILISILTCSTIWFFWVLWSL